MLSAARGPGTNETSKSIAASVVAHMPNSPASLGANGPRAAPVAIAAEPVITGEQSDLTEFGVRSPRSASQVTAGDSSAMLSAPLSTPHTSVVGSDSQLDLTVLHALRSGPAVPAVAEDTEVSNFGASEVFSDKPMGPPKGLRVCSKVESNADMVSPGEGTPVCGSSQTIDSSRTVGSGASSACQSPIISRVPSAQLCSKLHVIREVSASQTAAQGQPTTLSYGLPSSAQAVLARNDANTSS